MPSSEKLARPAIWSRLKRVRRRVIVIGPAFRNAPNTPGMTVTGIRVFLTSSHPKMPNLILTPEEIADVSAYILSLRDHP
jgi:hypothetical protein